jgi:hypothetical protein
VTSRAVCPGERYVIDRVQTPDPDSYAVLHYGGRYAFPCTRAWCEREQPAAGKYVVMGEDYRWHVEKEQP